MHDVKTTTGETTVIKPVTSVTVLANRHALKQQVQNVLRVLGINGAISVKKTVLPIVRLHAERVMVIALHVKVDIGVMRVTSGVQIITVWNVTKTMVSVWSVCRDIGDQAVKTIAF